MSTRPRQRTGRAVAQDLLSLDASPLYNQRLRKRRGLSPSILMVSFCLLPVVVFIFLVLKSISSDTTAVHQWNPKEEGHELVRHIVTVFMEPLGTLDSITKPMPPRKTNAEHLTFIEFPQVKQCSSMWNYFPIDEYPTSDPYLPWIHDYFLSDDGSMIKFVRHGRFGPYSGRMERSGRP